MRSQSGLRTLKGRDAQTFVRRYLPPRSHDVQPTQGDGQYETYAGRDDDARTLQSGKRGCSQRGTRLFAEEQLREKLRMLGERATTREHAASNASLSLIPLVPAPPNVLSVGLPAATA